MASKILRTDLQGLDYSALRATISIRRVLELIGYRPGVLCGDQWRGRCPLSTHPAARPTDRCFCVHLARNVYHCFGCHSAGNQLDLWVALTRMPFYQATLHLCQQLNIEPIYLASRNPQSTPHRTTRPATPGPT